MKPKSKVTSIAIAPAFRWLVPDQESPRAAIKLTIRDTKVAAMSDGKIHSFTHIPGRLSGGSCAIVKAHNTLPISRSTAIVKA